MKFGCGAAFNASYLSIVELYPSEYAAGAMGICNITGRLVTILAPLAAEMKGVVPYTLFTFLTASAAVSCIFLDMDVEKNRRKKEGKTA